MDAFLGLSGLFAVLAMLCVGLVLALFGVLMPVFVFLIHRRLSQIYKVQRSLLIAADKPRERGKETYVLRGADRSTGQPMKALIDARSREAAEDAAAGLGMLAGD
ncbi:MAG: hypothetical protein AAF668_13925 [Pseudomonadota bacterium]